MVGGGSGLGGRVVGVAATFRRPGDGLVLCVDEKSRVEALDRYLSAGPARLAADRIAEMLWTRWGGRVERHPPTGHGTVERPGSPHRADDPRWRHRVPGFHPRRLPRGQPHRSAGRGRGHPQPPIRVLTDRGEASADRLPLLRGLSPFRDNGRRLPTSPQPSGPLRSINGPRCAIGGPGRRFTSALNLSCLPSTIIRGDSWRGVHITPGGCRRWSIERVHDQLRQRWSLGDHVDG